MFWKKFFKTPVQLQKTKADIALDNLKSINLFDCNRLYSSDYAIIEIQTLFSNVIKYNKALETILYRFKTNSYLTTYDIPSDVITIEFRKFLLDSNNNYLDLDLHFSKFIHNSIEFLTIFIEQEKQDNKTSESIRNLRLSDIVVSNILQLTEELNNV
jgi:hypothetical protein